MPRVPSDDEIAYMVAHADDTLVTNILVCTVICGVLSAIIVALRVITRVYFTRGLMLDDWLIIFAWINFIVFDVCFALTTLYGAGKHIIFATDVRMLQILNIVNENIYCVAMAFIKFSLLSLYMSIFPSRNFRYLAIGVIIFMALWALSACIVSIVQCLPIAFGWNPTIPGGKCLNYGLLVLIAGVLNIFTDFLILAMPIPQVWQLNMSRQKKWLVIFTFAIGGSACIVSIVRLAFALAVGSTADGSWDNIPAGMLSTAELMVGILAASIPTFRPLYRRIFHGSAITDSQKRKDYASQERGYGAHSINITAGGKRGSFSGGIKVTDDIALVSHPRTSDSWVRIDDDEVQLYNGFPKAHYGKASPM